MFESLRSHESSREEYEVLRVPSTFTRSCEVAKLTTRCWREFQPSMFNQCILIFEFLSWEFDSPIECLRIPKSLYSAREVNKKPRKQYVHCIQNVYGVVDSRFLEGDLKRGLLQLSAYEICNLMDITVSLSTVLSTFNKNIIVGFLDLYVLPYDLAIDSDDDARCSSGSKHFPYDTPVELISVYAWFTGRG